MGFVALILALAIEQARPLARDNPVYRAAVALADGIGRTTDAGQRSHGLLGWLAAVGAAVLAVLVAEALLGAIGWLAVLALHVAVLYVTVGFRQFSHPFTEVQLALAANDLDGARRALDGWLRERDPAFSAADLPASEVSRTAIAHALLGAHRHVFGPLFWYMVLPGAVGPVLYRCAQFLAERWAAGAVPAESPQPEAYGAFARRAYRAIDWLPVRLTAAGFAIVGNFEDAVYCWRAAAAVRGGDEQRRLLLMAGGGAIGVRIADPRTEAEVRGEPAALDADPSLSVASGSTGFDWSGAEPDAAGLRSAVGLVWRSVVLWVLLFAMLTIAGWLGR